MKREVTVQLQHSLLYEENISHEELEAARKKLAPHKSALLQALGSDYEKDPRYRHIVRQTVEGKRTVAYIVADILDPQA